MIYVHYACGMLHMHVACYICMRHVTYVTYACGMLHMDVPNVHVTYNINYFLQAL